MIYSILQKPGFIIFRSPPKISDSITLLGISVILPFGSRYMDDIVVGI